MSSLATPHTPPHTAPHTRPPATRQALEPAPERPAASDRLDLYGPIHKALRLFMTDTLVRVGRLDTADAEACEPVLSQAEALLQQMRRHVEHENRFVHAAIEARSPGGAQHIADEHEHHLESIAALEDLVRALRASHGAPRISLAARLYRHLALFVADNLSHMHAEETRHNALLWSLYRDDELHAVHQHLMAHVEPAEMSQVLHWMVPALAPHELAGLFAELRESAPADVFQALLDQARDRLEPARSAALARALGLPPVPGLMTV